MEDMDRTSLRLREEGEGVGDYVGLQDLFDGSGRDVARYKGQHAGGNHLLRTVIWGTVKFILFLVLVLVEFLIVGILFLLGMDKVLRILNMR